MSPKFFAWFMAIIQSLLIMASRKHYSIDGVVVWYTVGLVVSFVDNMLPAAVLCWMWGVVHWYWETLCSVLVLAQSECMLLKHVKLLSSLFTLKSVVIPALLWVLPEEYDQSRASSF